MYSKPEITVLLPAYNASETISEAIESILCQSFENFEFLIINDGSSDNTLDIIQSYAQKDSRIRVINQKNMGLIATLNKGLISSSAKFIARMDADDISLPNRLELQFTLIKENPKISVCGSSIEIIETGEKYINESDPNKIKAFAIFGSPLTHPSVLMNKQDVLSVGGYSPDALHAEDYDLWDRMILHGFLLSNIKEVCLKYRLNLNKSRQSYSVQMAHTTYMIYRRILNRIGIFPSEHDIILHSVCAYSRQEPSWKVRQVKKWLDFLEAQNKIYRYVPQEDLKFATDNLFSKIKKLTLLNDSPAWIRRNLRHSVNMFLPLLGTHRIKAEVFIESFWYNLKNFKK